MTLPLEQQVCSLEPAKKLRELGVEQQSLFFISERDGRIISNEEYYDFLDFAANVGGGSVEQFCSAFTVAELGEMLPRGYWDESSVNGGFEIGYAEGKPMGAHGIDCYFVVEPNEANARAEMLIYLIEQGFIDPKTLSL